MVHDGVPRLTEPYRPRRSSPLAARLVPLRGEPTQAAVLAELRRVILAGDAPPGTVIPLDEVATVLGMSVIPVRESLKTLIGEGLVEQRSRSAYTVARLARSELLELYAARGVLENAVLAAAVAAAGPDDHARACAALDDLDRAVREGDLPAYHRESRRFHFALLEPAGMRRFTAMVGSAWNLTESYRPMARVSDADRRRLHADHAAMLAAFVAGDAAGLLACAAEHHGRLLGALATVPPGEELFATEPDDAGEPVHLIVINPNTTASMTATDRRVAPGGRRAGDDGRGGQPGPWARRRSRATTTRRSACPACSPRSRRAQAGDPRADGFVIACFGDPGLDAARELADGPVVGIAEAAMHAASFLGRGFSRGHDAGPDRGPGLGPRRALRHDPVLPERPGLRDPRAGAGGPGVGRVRGDRRRVRGARWPTTARRRSCWAAPGWPTWRRA